MSDSINFGQIKNYLHNPVIKGNLVLYGEQKINRFLTEIPLLQDEVIGRKTDIDNLQTALEQSKQVVLMNGLGGIGKTTTAAAYIEKYKDKYTHIAWLEHLTDLSTDVASNTVLTKNLGIKPSNDTVADTQLIFNTLSNLGGPSLLIIDNAHRSLQSFKNYLPRAPEWQVLITSREELAFTKIIKLGFLNEEAALELFYSHYDEKRDRDDEAVKRIFSAIDYHTLTIELLAKSAEKLRIAPLTKLADLLAERGIKIGRKLNLSTAHSGEEQVKQLFPYLKAIFQLDDAMTEREKWLLKQFIGLPPSFISFELLCDLLQINQEQEEEYDEFISALEQLKVKGWLNHDAGQEAYKMHRIVQEVMQAHLKPSFEEMEVLLKSVSSHLEIDQTKDNPVDKFPFLPLGERILSLFFEEQHEDMAELKNRLGWVYDDKGNYARAKELYQQALSWYESAGEKYENDIARLQSALAIVLKALGDYQGAKQLLQKALTSNEKNFGQEHPNTAIGYSNLATVLRALGDYQGAKQLLQKALTSDEKNFGQEHPSTTRRYSNLALVLQALGDYQGAKQLLQKAITSDEKNFGQDHPTVGLRKWILAEIYNDLEQFQEMIPYFQSAEKIMKSALGEEHPRVKRLIGNFGVAVLKGAAAGNSYCIQLKEEMGLEGE